MEGQRGREKDGKVWAAGGAGPLGCLLGGRTVCILKVLVTALQNEHRMSWLGCDVP